MKVYDDKLMVELKEYDLEKGHLEDAKILVKHHEAVPRKVHTEHYEMDGKKLRYEVEDAPAQDAWDEWETVKKYVPYTKAELRAIAEEKKKEQLEAEAHEQELKEAEIRKNLLDKIDAQVTYTALQTNTLLPSEE